MEPIDVFPRMWKMLADEQADIEMFNKWYDDEQPKPNLPDDYDDTAIGHLIEICSENWAGLIVDTPVDRLRVVGMRFGGDDSAAWDLWQANSMDAAQDYVFRDAMISGRGPMMVTEDPSSPVGVRITPEDPREVIVLYDPATRRAVAALKAWTDLAGYGRAEVMTEGRLMRGRTKQPRPDFLRITNRSTSTELLANWGSVDSWDWDETSPGPNSIPIVEAWVGARTGRRPRSYLAPHLKALKVINLMGFDLALATEFAAYKQRWVTGLEMEDDKHGQPKAPFKHGLMRMFVGEDPDTKFGEFGESDLGNYTTAIEHRVAGLMSRAKCPSYYWASRISNISADTIRAADAGLVAFVEGLQRQMSEPIEELMRQALRIAGLPGADDLAAELVWADPRNHTDGQLADALVKRRAIDVPVEVLWADAGYSPQQIPVMRRMRAREKLEATLEAQAPPVEVPVVA